MFTLVMSVYKVLKKMLKQKIMIDYYIINVDQFNIVLSDYEFYQIPEAKRHIKYEFISGNNYKQQPRWWLVSFWSLSSG